MYQAFLGYDFDKEDDADGVECLPTEVIFTELARMGYEKLPPKLKFYKAFFSTQWKFLIHTLVQCVSAKRTAWNEFNCSMASAVICLATCRKFNFSKYIFESMVRNVDSPSKFLMMHPNRGRIKVIDADEDITLVDMETKVNLGVELQGRIERKDDDNVAAKEVNVVEPTMFDDEEVTMTMAQTLINMKAKKARILDEQMAKRLHDEEVKQAAAREKQEQDDLKRAQVLQQFEYTQDTPTVDHKEMSEEDVKNMLQIVPVAEFKVEALQKLHSNCGVHQVSSTTRRHDIFMLTEKDYPLSNGVMTLMLSTKLKVKEDSEMARDLVMKIFMKANQPKSRSLDTSSK
nr:synaptobrevin, longin-like domain protein [Tanacetum cinerariifolium]